MTKHDNFYDKSFQEQIKLHNRITITYEFNNKNFIKKIFN